MRIAFLGDSLTEGRPGESFFVRLQARLPGDELLNHGRAGDTVPGLRARLERSPLGPLDLAVVWIGTNDAFLGDWYLPELGDAWGLGETSELDVPREPEPGVPSELNEGSAPGTAAADSAPRRPANDRLRAPFDRILDLALEHAPLAVCVPPVLPDPFEPDGVTERVAGIGMMIADAVAARGPKARIFDLAPAFEAARRGPGPGFTIDGVHLSARGADVVAAAFFGLIETVRSARSESPAR